MASHSDFSRERREATDTSDHQRKEIKTEKPLTLRLGGHETTSLGGCVGRSSKIRWREASLTTEGTGLAEAMFILGNARL